MTADEAARSADEQTSPDRTFRVLVVCRANICRSPTAQLLLRRQLETRSLAKLIEVSTAGDGVVPGRQWCSEAAKRVSPGADRDELLASHRATALSLEQIVSSDLVLTAARAQRASVVRL